MKKFFCVVLSLMMIFSITGCKNNKQVQEDFDAFIEQEFIDTMENDYLSMHVYLENPKEYGVDVSKVKVSLGTYLDEESQEKAIQDENNSYKKLKEFDREQLIPLQQDIYDIYEYNHSLNEKLNDEKFDYYQPVFESMTGLHYQIPTLFADWKLRNEQDVKDLILLVKDVKPYISSALEYTRKQEEKGLLMLDLDSIMEYCQNIIDKGEKSSILESMNKSIDALSLDKDKENNYIKQLKEAFASSFIPAYQDIYDTMNTFKKSGKNNTEGLSKFEHGKEYYELRLQQRIGSLKTTDEVKEMMEKAYSQHLSTLQKVVMNNADKMTPLITNDLPKTSLRTIKKFLIAIRIK